MVSVILLADDNERRMVATLSALVSGAATGLLRDVIMAAPRHEHAVQETIARVADVAGCRVVSVDGTLATARDTAADAARSTWLLILRSGAIPEAGWTDEVAQFLERDFGDRPQTAAFRHARSPYRRATLAYGAGALMRVAFGPFADQGLLIDAERYREITKRAPTSLSDSQLLSKIGRRNIATLRTRLFAP